ncbi:MAG: peptidoglycan DD-metalloendopeptidase family protein [Chloroflexota bacterium]|nr:peptidoglycan DD-metalloendopeptidase family protein [Chloroflexota bacterium]
MPTRGQNPVAAAPPESELQFASVPQPGADELPSDERSPQEQPDSSGGSVRARGHEAPVELSQEPVREEQAAPGATDEPVPEGRDPGDGPVARLQNRANQSDRASLPSRIWPMPAESYTLTQDFGCTQQLGNLYFPGEGCPASEPVIHTGLDMAAPEGTPFYAAASGWVTLADYDRPTSDANTRIIIQHDGRNEGFSTDYLHWIASYVEEGDYVRAGDPIGEVGSVGFSTGAHLHFSVTDLETGEFTDPMRWLPKESGPSDYSRSESRAKLRLPAGTTAGQPESADPSPPEPAVRERVPRTPPDETSTSSDRSARKDSRGRANRAANADNSAAAADGTRTRRGRSAADAPVESTAAKETVVEGDTTQRDRRRERNKNGVDEASVDSGADTAEPDTSTEETDATGRRNRKTADTAGNGGKPKQNETDASSGGQSNGGGNGGGRNNPGNGGNGSGNGNGNGNGKDGKRSNNGSGAIDGGTGQPAPGDGNGDGTAGGGENGGGEGAGNWTEGGNGSGDGAPVSDPSSGDGTILTDGEDTEAEIASAASPGEIAAE